MFWEIANTIKNWLFENVKRIWGWIQWLLYLEVGCFLALLRIPIYFTTLSSIQFQVSFNLSAKTKRICIIYYSIALTVEEKVVNLKELPNMAKRILKAFSSINCIIFMKNLPMSSVFYLHLLMLLLVKHHFNDC